MTYALCEKTADTFHADRFHAICLSLRISLRFVANGECHSRRKSYQHPVVPGHPHVIYLRSCVGVFLTEVPFLLLMLLPNLECEPRQNPHTPQHFPNECLSPVASHLNIALLREQTYTLNTYNNHTHTNSHVSYMMSSGGLKFDTYTHSHMCALSQMRYSSRSSHRHRHRRRLRPPPPPPICVRTICESARGRRGNCENTRDAHNRNGMAEKCRYPRVARRKSHVCREWQSRSAAAKAAAGL